MGVVTVLSRTKDWRTGYNKSLLKYTASPVAPKLINWLCRGKIGVALRVFYTSTANVYLIHPRQNLPGGSCQVPTPSLGSPGPITRLSSVATETGARLLIGFRALRLFPPASLRVSGPQEQTLSAASGAARTGLAARLSAAPGSVRTASSLPGHQCPLASVRPSAASVASCLVQRWLLPRSTHSSRIFRP